MHCQDHNKQDLKVKIDRWGKWDLDHGLAEDLSEGFALEAGGGEPGGDDADHPAPEPAGPAAEVEMCASRRRDRRPEQRRVDHPRPGSRRRIRGGGSADRHRRADKSRFRVDDARGIIGSERRGDMVTQSPRFCDVGLGWGCRWISCNVCCFMNQYNSCGLLGCPVYSNWPEIILEWIITHFYK